MCLKGKRKVIAIIILVVLFEFALFQIFFSEGRYSRREGENIRSLEIYPLSDPRISLNGNTELIDYTYNTGGNGTSWADAVILEYFEIDCSGTLYSCIEIQNTNVFLIIQNCTLTGSPSASDKAGIRLINCSNVRIIECKIKNGYDGIYISDNSANVLISSCNISYNSKNGIESDVGGVTISENTICHNNERGIHIWGDSNTISGNNISHNPKGITLGGKINLVSHNSFSFNSELAIELDADDSVICWNTFTYDKAATALPTSSENNTLYENKMFGCGITDSQSYNWNWHIDVPSISSNKISTSNTVNGNPVYFYANETNLGAPDFQFAGQIFLLNCNDSTISGLDISNTSIGVFLLLCHNIKIFDVTANYNRENGIRAFRSKNITITNNIANSNDETGIIASDGANFVIDGNNASYNLENGFQIGWYSSDFNCTITDNTADHNNASGFRISVLNSTIHENYASSNNLTGIKITFTNHTTITNNEITGSVETGLIVASSFYNNISGNIATNCGTYGLSLGGFTYHCTISSNDLQFNDFAVKLYFSQHNLLWNNNASFGISGGFKLEIAVNNEIHDNFINYSSANFKCFEYIGTTQGANSIYNNTCFNVTQPSNGNGEEPGPSIPGFSFVMLALAGIVGVIAILFKNFIRKREYLD